MKKLFIYTIISLIIFLLFSGAGCLNKKEKIETPSPAPQETTTRKNGVSIAPKDVPKEAKIPENQVSVTETPIAETVTVQKTVNFDIVIMLNSEFIEEEKNDKFEEKTYKTSENKEKIFEYYKNEAENTGWKKTLENNDMVSFKKEENDVDVTILDSQDDNVAYSVKYWK